MKLQLNKRTIDLATYKGPGGCYLWDSEVRGLGLRIYPTGLKSFVLTNSHKGWQRFFPSVASVSSPFSNPGLRASATSW